MAKNNGHQNCTKSLGIPSPPPPLFGSIPQKTFFGGFHNRHNKERGMKKGVKRAALQEVCSIELKEFSVAFYNTISFCQDILQFWST